MVTFPGSSLVRLVHWLYLVAYRRQQAGSRIEARRDSWVEIFLAVKSVSSHLAAHQAVRNAVQIKVELSALMVALDRSRSDTIDR